MQQSVARLRARILGAAAAATLVVTGTVVLSTTAEASTAGDAVVISEVYGGGGNSGAPYQNDFIELYNPTDSAVDLAGMSVQYRSASGTSGGVPTALVGTLPAGEHWLVQEAAGSGSATPLPTPDTTGTLAMAAGAGIVVLARSTTLVATNDPAVVDLVGYGSTATSYETAPTANLSNTTSASRNVNGTDTDDNAADFTVSAPTPTSSGVAGPTCPGGAMAIADIQGDTDTSPCVGVSVTADGVVTAAYPTGGFNGFYLQTAGSGGDLDPAQHTASDGIFVFSSAAASAVRIGDHVQVDGKVSEFNGLTEIAPASGGVTVLDTPAAAVKPATVPLPGSAAQRESLEGMLVDLQGPFTITDNYSLNQYAEISLASGTEPLWQPTEIADPHDSAAIAAVVTSNASHKVTLDDGATTNFFTNANKGIPLPWLTQDHQIRVGAPAAFSAPMVLDYRNGLWKLQPTSQLTAAGEPPVTFGHTRTSAPEEVGGDVQIASFNVLNYFPTTGADWVASGGSCTWYDDRDGNHITVNDCGPTGPRGAADDVNLARQQAKIVHAINGLGADVVSLEEIENSARFGQPRDAAVSTLVDALNADAGGGTWAFVPTPSTAGDQTDEDVIRTAFVYRTAVVEPVGESVIDDATAFGNARDPLAQGFEPVGRTSASRFVVIVNHFKSKGSGVDDGTGQGNANPDRVAQAHELVTFADQMQTHFGSAKVFLSGDFNAYTQEDPIKVLEDAGYTDIGSTRSPGEHTYLFGGVVGSLDHVFGNAAAIGTVTGAHVWNINSVEPVAREYSRYNYNATLFYDDSPYRASDHDPLLVGLDTTAPPVTTSVSAGVSPDPVPVARKGISAGQVTVQVSSPRDTVDAGTVELYDGTTPLGSATVSSSGVATIPLPAYKKKGSHTLTVRYLGTALFEPSEATVSFEVSNK